MPAATHSKDYVVLAGGLSPELAAALLTPITGEHRAGESLRYAGVYDRVAEARREDDSRLEQGVWQKDLKRADWAAVAQLCGEALESHSKDLQLAAWLTEAWGRLHGFAGIEAGLELIAALCGEYWPDLYPPLEDPEYRIAPFHWLNEKLSVSLQMIPLTRAGAAEGYGWADWLQAVRAEQERRQHGNTVPMPEPSPAQIEQALRRSPSAALAAARAAIERSGAIALDLESFLDGHLAAAHPSLRQLRATLADIGQWMDETAGATTALAPALESSAAAEPAAMTEALTAPTSPLAAGQGYRITSRADAYRLLGEAAAFLMRTEPHSPTPYLVARAIRWGSLPLDQLLPEMIGNSGALEDLQKLLNLPS
ncbi:MAG: type VI secretion system protein TssA [Terriglobales bacterium]